MNPTVWLLTFGLLGGRVIPGATVAPLPASALAVWSGGEWRAWWSSVAAPTEWNGAHPELARAVAWRPAAPGVGWAEVRLAGSGEAWRIRLIVARLDPRRVRFRLDTAFRRNGNRPDWSVGTARRDALFAVNAGQFPYSLPWGWVVLNGRELLRPGVGPLSAGVAFDSAGGVRWIDGDSLQNPLVRRGVQAGFQSYPHLLKGGVVPEALRAEGRGVNLSHRDARAAIGQTADGAILVVLSRFDGADGVLDFLPFGLTTAEMAAVMGGLGARDAVMLDGGISSQMLLREGKRTRRWPGLRKVPLGLVAVSREDP